MVVTVKRRIVPRSVETEGQGESEMTMDQGIYQNPPQPQPIVVNVPPQQTPPAADDKLDRKTVEEMINAERERVRQEEKDKLYPQIEEQKAQLKTLSEEREERLRLEEEAKAAAEEEERKRQEEAMSLQEQLAQTSQSWEERFAQMQADRDQERALRQKEQEFAEISGYRYQRLQEENDNIAPQFVEFVEGATKEQIDQRIEMVKAKTAEIVAEVQQAGVNNRRQLAPPVSGAPPVDMTGQGQDNTRTFTAAEIANMDMAEYQQYRQQLLGAGSQRVKEQGLYAP
jgi:hypothetical protein